MPDASSSVLKKKVPRRVGCLVLVFLLSGIWAVFEFQAERTVLAKPLEVYRDPDHRLLPDDPTAETNSDGLRCALEAEALPAEAMTILFAGDSFVFGVAVDRKSALPALFERGLREKSWAEKIHVINAAWPSASPLLALRLLRDVGAKYRPDLVLYGFDMSDFRDDLMYRNLIEKKGVYRMIDLMPASLWLAGRGAKAIVPDRLYERFFRMPKDRFFPVNRPLSETRQNLMPVWETLVEINRVCKEELEADFRLVVLPRNFQYSDRESPASWERGDYENLGPWVLAPFRFFEEQAAAAPFPIHSLLPAFQETDVFPTCYIGDPHWTPAGAQVAADALVEMAITQEWLPPPDSRRTNERQHKISVEQKR